MVLNIVILAGAIACAAVCCLLWWAFGRYASNATKVLFAIVGAVLGYAVYFLLQIGWEEMHPEARGPNGDILAYDVHYFTLALAVVVVAMFFVRRTA